MEIWRIVTENGRQSPVIQILRRGNPLKTKIVYRKKCLDLIVLDMTAEFIFEKNRYRYSE